MELNERSSDAMYYFREIATFIDMLRSNRIVASLAFSNEFETKKQLDKKYPYYISTTSTKSFEIGYQGSENLPVRLKLRGDLMNSDFKIKRVAYFDHDQRTKYTGDTGKHLHSNLDELEERVYLTKSSIPFSRYVEEVTINSEYAYNLPLEKINDYLNKLGIKFNVLGNDIDDNFGDIETDYNILDDPDDDVVVFFSILCDKLDIDFKSILGRIFGDDRAKNILNDAMNHSNIIRNLDKIKFGYTDNDKLNSFKMELNNIFAYDKSSSGNLELLSVLGKILKKHNLTNHRNIFGLLYGKK